MLSGPMAGFVVCVFDLILEFACVWPQTDKVYLSLAAAQKYTRLVAQDRVRFAWFRYHRVCEQSIM